MKGGGSFSNPPKRVVIPANGESSGDPYIVITGDTSLFGTTFASVAFYSPSLPTGYSFRATIYESATDVANWNLELVDENGTAVEEPFAWAYDKAANIMALTVGNDNITLPGGFKGTTVSAQNEVQLKCVVGDTFIDGGNSIQIGRLLFPDAGVLFGTAANEVEIQTYDRVLGFENGNVWQDPAPADTRAINSLANIVGATQLVFTKHHDDTDLEFTWNAGVFATAGGTTGAFALNDATLGATRMCRFLCSAANVEVPVNAIRKVSGINAGTYTFVPQWERLGGAGTLTMAATSQTLSWSVKEVIAP